jgi:hypothetical protein
MDEEESAEHHWPEQEPDAAPKQTAKQGRLARLGRAIGETSLTIGMGQGLVGGKAGDGNRALNNAMLIDEAKSRSQD